MSNLCVFFNTKVENSGALAWIGDQGLAPFRYLFNGKTIRVQTRDQQIEIHHVASFHKLGSKNVSRTTGELESSSTGMIKTVSAVVLLIPGLLFAVSKVFAYLLFSDVRERHSLAKEHLTPVDRHIGTVDEPIQTIKDLEQALSQEFKSDLKHRPTNALIIHGNKLAIKEDPGILCFNPMKLVLVGAAIVHGPSYNRIMDKMRATHKWECIEFIPETSKISVNSIEEALQTTAPWRSFCKRWHLIFTLNKPQCDTTTVS